MFDKNFFDNIKNELFEVPREVGTEAVGQIKGKKNDDNGKQKTNAFAQDPQDDQQQQKYLQDLYGISSLDDKQLEIKKRQENAVKKSNYQKIQQEIQEYRAKKSRKKTAYEKSFQKGTKAANTQEEEMELWQKEQKKAEEKKKKQEAITMPGSQQSRSGEQGVVMG